MNRKKACHLTLSTLISRESHLYQYIKFSHLSTCFSDPQSPYFFFPPKCAFIMNYVNDLEKCMKQKAITFII